MTLPQINMKSFKYILQGIITTVFLFAMYWLFTQTFPTKEELKIGQTWVYIQETEDPFKQSPPEYRKIIDIKNDYIQFIINDNDTTSVTKKEFLIDCNILTDTK